MATPKHLDPKNKIVKAVAPLKERAVIQTRERCHAQIACLIADLAKVEGRVDEYAPAHDWRNKDHPIRGTLAYALMIEKRAFVYQIFTARKREDWTDKSPTVVLFDTRKAGEYIENEVARAVASYNAWVYKLIGKIGEVSKAKLRDADADLWGYSHLEVVSVERGPEVWKTQEIVNCSKLGKYFNQWPTRKLKN